MDVFLNQFVPILAGVVFGSWFLSAVVNSLRGLIRDGN